ncbi:hypothetical protein SAMN02910275_00003 [Butyrivibrio sp. INlla18]|uniref:hypothetical protein n=1 Tax=Butyrivibrio sp. INlla18 TaxID=1520806 RepID=UPI00087EABF9|nr:hypothetical protein [Butyrivibrio sp. INlla18]SDA37528.1 hypothetical protein SAMN02910275_00003 [Butyrivibrio sp. INlla18]
MYGIFRECLVDLQRYGGLGNGRSWIIFWLLLLISSIYLIVKESDVRKKIIFGVIPLVIVAGFLFPITKKLYVKVARLESANTYYRILWIIPMYVTIAYAFTKFIMSIKSSVKKHIAVGILAVVIAITGSCVYANEHVYLVENIYHLPQNVIDICDRIKPTEDEGIIRAAFTPELVYFVRQYDPNILMPYGRDYVDHNYYTGVLRVMKEEEIETQELLYYTRVDLDRYIILPTNKRLDEKITNFDVKLAYTIDGYNIYEDILISENREKEREDYVTIRKNMYE